MITNLLSGWKLIAAASLISAAVAGVGGYQLRDLSAARDLAQEKQKYTELEKQVAVDAANANQRSLSELARLTTLYNQLQEQYLLERQQRIQTSQHLTEPLRREPPDESTIGPALSDYLTRLREYQRSRNNSQN